MHLFTTIWKILAFFSCLSISCVPAHTFGISCFKQGVHDDIIHICGWKHSKHDLVFDKVYHPLRLSHSDASLGHYHGETGTRKIQTTTKTASEMQVCVCVCVCDVRYTEYY